MVASRKDIDGGYAWVVLGAVFCLKVISGFLVFSPGVTNLAILEEVEDDLTKTSWIGSTLMGTNMMFGPVAGLINKRLGPRKTTITGGILLLVGMTAAFFCRSVTGLIFTYGFITGVGISLGGNVVGAVPGEYFIRRRALAYGISMSGGALGLFVGGSLTQYLLEQYGIHGTLLLLGAMSFHCCLTGVILREKGPVLMLTSMHTASESCSQSDGNCGHCINKTEKLTINSNATGDDEDITLPLQQISAKTFDDSDVSRHKTGDDGDANIPESENMKIQNVTVNMRGRKSKGSTRCCKFNFKNVSGFIVYNISMCMWGMADSACMFHLPNYAKLRGSSHSQAASLFMAMGVGSVIARPLVGLIASDSRIGDIILHVGLIGIAGTLSLLFPLYSYSYYLQMTYSTLYGMYSDGMVSLIAPITISFIGLSNIAVGFGIVSFSMGTGYFLGPTVSSLVYSYSGSYDLTFIFAGSCLILSSITTAVASVLKTKSTFPMKM